MYSLRLLSWGFKTIWPAKPKILTIRPSQKSLPTPDLAEGRGNEDAKVPLPSTMRLVAPILEVSGPTGFCMMSFLFLALVTGLGSRRRFLPDTHRGLKHLARSLGYSGAQQVFIK